MITVGVIVFGLNKDDKHNKTFLIAPSNCSTGMLDVSGFASKVMISLVACIK